MALGKFALLTLLLAGNAAASTTQPPRLPWWLADSPEMRNRVALQQSAAFTRSGLRVCRRLVNISARPVLINRLNAGAAIRGQLTTWLFSARGLIFESQRFSGHPSFIPPMIAAGPDDMTPFEIIAPNGAAEDCENVTLPRGSLFQVVSHYSSDLLEDGVPASAQRDATLFAHGKSILSGVCVVRVRSRSVTCTDERRWIVAPRPPGMQ